MLLRVEPSSLGGEVWIPASKSHTIRAVAIASLAPGESLIRNPLDSEDGRSAVTVYRALGAEIECSPGLWRVRGVGGRPRAAEDIIHVGNSGTSCRLGIGSAALSSGANIFTGDAQTRRRPMGPLLDALRSLGAEAFSNRGNGLLPVVVRGPMKGGFARVAGITSQYTSSLLLCCPLAARASEVEVEDLRERPYVDMTLWWLDRQGVRYEREGYERFRVAGGQSYRAYDAAVPGDFSSAAFFLGAAAVTGSTLTLRGLDRGDPQGDKAMVEFLREMGCAVEWLPDGVRVEGGELRGGAFDLSDTPDLLPMMAVLGTRARGRTELRNVPQARIKETDRIASMRQALEAMGGRARELPDGIIIEESRLKGGRVPGFGDHRVVMAMAVAGLVAEGVTLVDTAEAIAVTFPDFAERMREVGASIERVGEKE